MLKDEYKNMSTAEKILLVEEIWDSISEDAKFTLSKEQKEMLERREIELLEGKVKTKSWGEIKKNLKKKRKK